MKKFMFLLLAFILARMEWIQASCLVIAHWNLITKSLLALNIFIENNAIKQPSCAFNIRLTILLLNIIT